MINNFNYKELWRRRTETFCVEVSHNIEESINDTEVTNYWCIYAYIYPAHPYFEKFKGDRIYQDAAMNMPLHRGPSFLRWHYDKNGNPISVQVGADYNHYGDNIYTFYRTEDDAHDIFNDANKLVEWLKAHDNRHVERI